jgi:hypothetical protein
VFTIQAVSDKEICVYTGQVHLLTGMVYLLGQQFVQIVMDFAMIEGLSNVLSRSSCFMNGQFSLSLSLSLSLHGMDSFC